MYFYLLGLNERRDCMYVIAVSFYSSTQEMVDKLEF